MKPLPKMRRVEVLLPSAVGVHAKGLPEPIDDVDTKVGMPASNARTKPFVLPVEVPIFPVPFPKRTVFDCRLPQPVPPCGTRAIVATPTIEEACVLNQMVIPKKISAQASIKISVNFFILNIKNQYPQELYLQLMARY